MTKTVYEAEFSYRPILRKWTVERETDKMYFVKNEHRRGGEMRLMKERREAQIFETWEEAQAWLQGKVDAKVIWAKEVLQTYSDYAAGVKRMLPGEEAR